MTTGNQETSLIGTPVNKMLIKMATPISLGMLSTFLFQIVDTYFVGLLGSAELAALTFASNAYLVFVSVFMGISVGVSSVVANLIGKGERKHARGLTSLALLLVLTIAGLLCIAGDRSINQVFTALGASPDILPLIDAYMSVLYLSFPLLMLGIVGSGAIRAIGITRDSEIVFAIAGVINLVFDYLLIFGKGPFPELGLAGAAWATALSFLFIFLGIGALLIRHKLLGAIAFARVVGDLREILTISIPATLMQILVPVTAVFVTFLLAGYGPDAVAAFGVAARVEALALIGIFAVSMATTPFVAQNFGAGEHDRIDQAIIFAGKASIYLGAGLFVILALTGPKLAEVFSNDPAIIEFVGLYFKVVALSYGFQGIINVTAAIFNGLQMPGKALNLMIVRTCVFVFPALFAASLIGLFWILVALSAANILAAFNAGRLMRTSVRKWDRPIADANPVADIANDIKGLFRRIF